MSDLASCDACDATVVPASSLAAHPADDFPYDWLLCPACRRRPAAEILRAEVGS